MTTRYYVDTEFLEDGRTIDLISIGIVCEDGREYYAVNADAPWDRIAQHGWLMGNVVPSLPRLGGEARQRWIDSRSQQMSNPVYLDHGDRNVKPKTQIADEVKRFLLSRGTPELVAWYASFDHVCLAWLFGPMSDMPAGIPYWTYDLKQEATRLGLTDDDLPQQTSGIHNALADARHNLVRARYMEEFANPQRTAKHVELGEACQHCDPPTGHRDPSHGAWGVWVDPTLDSDGQPTTIRVERPDGAHVAGVDAQWIRNLIDDAQEADR